MIGQWRRYWVEQPANKCVVNTMSSNAVGGGGRAGDGRDANVRHKPALAASGRRGENMSFRTLAKKRDDEVVKQIGQESHKPYKAYDVLRPTYPDRFAGPIVESAEDLSLIHI